MRKRREMKKYFYKVHYFFVSKPTSKVDCVNAESPEEALDIIQSKEGSLPGYWLGWVYVQGERVL